MDTDDEDVDAYLDSFGLSGAREDVEKSVGQDAGQRVQLLCEHPSAFLLKLYWWRFGPVTVSR